MILSEIAAYAVAIVIFGGVTAALKKAIEDTDMRF